QSYTSDYNQPDSAYSTQQHQQQPSSQQAGPNAMPENEPPRKRQRTTMTPIDTLGGSAGYGQNMDLYATAFPGSPTEPNESFVYTQNAMHDQTPDEELN